MGPRLPARGVFLALAGLVLIVGCLGGGERRSAGEDEGAPAESAEEAASREAPPGAGEAAAPIRKDIQVLFASGEDDLLHAQTRTIFWTAALEDRAKQVLAELLAGPSEGLLPALPPEVKLREFYLMPDGTAFVDLSKEVLGLRGGVASEQAAIYAIVNTLALNFPEVRRVGIVVEGEEVETLSGHLDLRYPFKPDPAILEPALAESLRTRRSPEATPGQGEAQGAGDQAATEPPG